MSAVTITGRIAVRGGERHVHAARRLRQAFPQLTWIALADGDTDPADVPTIALREDTTAHPEGGFRLAVDASAGAPRVTIEGGYFSGVIYGAEELIQRRMRAVGGAVQLDVVDDTQRPGLTYRTWWNWDHSTNWELEQIGIQEIGVMNPYGKPANGFLKDMKRAVDFMSMHRIAALVIYGFFRDSHGGVEAAQELCRYANERGVRILPGVANLAYGGIYWEGNHPFNLGTWLRKNPKLAATMEREIGFQIPGLGFRLYFPRSEYGMSGCPSRAENQQWMRDGIAWLAETCEIGGINFEAGDYGVCGCQTCAGRRHAREDAERRQEYVESWSHADMADFYPTMFQAALDKRPNLWMYSELQWDNLLDQEVHAEFMRVLPEGGIYQHTLNRGYWNRVQNELTADYVQTLPTRTNVFRCQFGCQWGGDERTERYAFNGRVFAAQAKKAAEVGMQGLTVWGEPSPVHPAVELGYLSYARHAWDPALTWDRFIAEEAAPRLGGVAAAERFIAMLERLDTDRAIDATALRSMRGEALDAARHPDDGVSRRWAWLASRLDARRFNGGAVS